MMGATEASADFQCQTDFINRGVDGAMCLAMTFGVRTRCSQPALDCLQARSGFSHDGVGHRLRRV